MTDVSLEYVIRGNSAILKCNIPSFVADFVSVQAWITDKGDTYYPSQNYGKQETQGAGRGGASIAAPWGILCLWFPPPGL
ncbi:hypothetical protein E2C01_095026 [Portunus trituberculatus]|uniref:Down syndrome cell adhesion molecule-like protein Dscam2 n=1 Tax=Portunus trituberculatus TaxID=210409 RepID=A0A5B7JS21_PORTR|nr:hypothetical protein [Portunus trituberculatus]